MLSGRSPALLPLCKELAGEYIIVAVDDAKYQWVLVLIDECLLSAYTHDR